MKVNEFFFTILFTLLVFVMLVFVLQAASKGKYTEPNFQYLPVYIYLPQPMRQVIPPPFVPLQRTPPELLQRGA